MNAERLAAAFEALDAYGCNNTSELSALIGTHVWEELHWDGLADLILATMEEQALHLIGEGERLRREYSERAMRVRGAISKAKAVQ